MNIYSSLDSDDYVNKITHQVIISVTSRIQAVKQNSNYLVTIQFESQSNQQREIPKPVTSNSEDWILWISTFYWGICTGSKTSGGSATHCNTTQRWEEPRNDLSVPAVTWQLHVSWTKDPGARPAALNLACIFSSPTASKMKPDNHLQQTVSVNIAEMAK